jgi:hypothetical protein
MEALAQHNDKRPVICSSLLAHGFGRTGDGDTCGRIGVTTAGWGAAVVAGAVVGAAFGAGAGVRVAGAAVGAAGAGAGATQATSTESASSRAMRPRSVTGVRMITASADSVDFHDCQTVSFGSSPSEAKLEPEG